MLEGKGFVKETDMAVKMQIEAMACASEALDLYDVSDCISISAHIKKEYFVPNFICNWIDLRTCRNLTKDMGADGNVWWVQTLVVSSLIQRGLLSTLGLSSRVPLLEYY
ncbi:hypothetical protein RHSIM_Rhsim04G0017100 [Rhododendron simsii]|uniref:Dynein light chain n=1 Tax=Rhododendron simsii TaxID=118357 RepID=A0A834H5G5_RHOSS|nr:hypothetical protein RHSIM_Rhsim04G0017100 [Rhododendron simsii]